MDDAVKMLAMIICFGALVVFLGLFLNAADCPPGTVAMKDLWGWPVCISTGGNGNG